MLTDAEQLQNLPNSLNLFIENSKSIVKQPQFILAAYRKLGYWPTYESIEKALACGFFESSEEWGIDVQLLHQDLTKWRNAFGNLHAAIDETEPLIDAVQAPFFERWSHTVRRTANAIEELLDNPALPFDIFRNCEHPLRELSRATKLSHLKREQPLKFIALVAGQKLPGSISVLVAQLQAADSDLRPILQRAKGAKAQVGPDWISVSQAAEISGIDKPTISRAVSSGRLKGVGTNQNRRICPADFTRWQLERVDKPERIENPDKVTKKLRD